MNPERSVEIAGQAYSIVFSTNAAFQLGTYLRQNALGTMQDFMLRLIRGDSDLVDIQILLWACLEGGRRRSVNGRPNPYTVDEVGDLIEQAGGLTGVARALLDAVKAASPTPDKDAGGNGAAGGRKNGRASTSRTGKRSSATRRKSASARKGSGT